MSRTARVQRTTKESDVLIELNLDGTGVVDIETQVPFYDHMLSQLGKHGGFDLHVRTKGDIEVDPHHTVEDTALALGQALREALGDKAGIRRFGDALVPLDETIEILGAPVVITALVHVIVAALPGRRRREEDEIGVAREAVDERGARCTRQMFGDLEALDQRKATA